jgi:hypothetical protein
MNATDSIPDEVIGFLLRSQSFKPQGRLNL